MKTVYKIHYYRHEYRGRMTITRERAIATLDSVGAVLKYAAEHAPGEDLDEIENDLDSMGVAWFGHYTATEYTVKED